MKINITQNHINKGTKNNALLCPIAHCLREEFDDVYVGYDFITFGENRITTPKKIQKFIHEFDQGKKVEPTIFKLNV